MKKYIENMVRFIVPLAALVAAFYVPNVYIKMGQVRGVMDDMLHLEVDPVFSGGRVLAKFMDPAGDDSGEGGLVYPLHASFRGENGGKGYLDVVRYTVYQPVTNGRWSNEIDYWQMALTFAGTGNPLNAKRGFSHPVIHIYIDIDGDKGGSTETFFPRAELVTFDEKHPWDFMVHIDGFSDESFIVSHDKKFKEPVALFFVKEKRTVYVRILLENKTLKNILDGRTTWHYVVVGAYDPLGPGGFMAVKKNPGQRNGGGARSGLTPRVYDWVDAKGAKQASVLSSYNEDTYQYAQLIPLEVNKTAGQQDNQEKIKTIIAQYIQNIQNRREARQKNPSQNAEAALKHMQKEAAKGTKATKLIYTATITAMKAGQQKDLSKALSMVNEAFALFEKAEAACTTDKEQVTLLLQRANVYMSVPEDVFHKTAPAAEDFLKAASLLEKIRGTPKCQVIDCYLNAAKAYKIIGKKDEEEICLTRAAALIKKK